MAGLVIFGCGGKNPEFPLETMGIDFSNGNFDFLRIDSSSVGANRAQLVLIDYPGESAGEEAGVGEESGRRAVKVEVSGSGIPFVVIDAGSLLGNRVKELYEMRVTLGVDNPSGEFHAVSGEILAYSGENRIETYDSWSVYLPHKNPNIARAVLETEREKFIPNAYNFFILTKRVDNAVTAGKGPSNLIISEIHFFDAQGRELPVNPNASFAAPEGFWQQDRTNRYALRDEQVFPDSEGSSKNGGQAVTLTAIKNGGALDPALLSPDGVVTVYYSSPTPPELILQSWTDGAPENAGWAKIPPGKVNDSSTAAQYPVEDLAAAFGAHDFARYLDRLYVGDTGGELTVHAVTIGTMP
jgi:hypothetical protein